MRTYANLYHYKIRFFGLQGVFLFPEIFVIFIKKSRKAHTFLATVHTIFMKKNEHLPDFAKLCAPEQNHIALFISQQIFFFFLCATCGFIWEVLIMYLKDGYFANRGFLYGPWLPIYGAGGVLLYLILGQKELLAPQRPCTECLLNFQNRRFHTSQKKVTSNHTKKHPIRVFLLSMLLGTGLELLIGWFLDTIWNLRYWDYTSYPLNYHGYICLWSAIGFGIAGILWVCILSGIVTRLWLRLSTHTRNNINALLVLLFLLDCAASLIFPNTGNNITFP